MQVKELIEKSTKLFSVKYYDKNHILRAKVSTTEIGMRLERKKLELEGFEIVEEKLINCKGEDFEEKVENENLDEIKKEIEKK